MIPFRRILCPVDFSTPAHEALKAAAELAQHFDAELWVIHVVVAAATLPAPRVYPEAMNVPEIQQELDTVSQHTLDETVANHVPEGLRVHSVLLEGSAAEEIVKFAAEHAVDLVVISTHGRTGWQRLIFGSVAEHVMRAAPCAVLSLRAPQPEEENDK